MAVLNDTTGAPIGVAGNPLEVSGTVDIDLAYDEDNPLIVRRKANTLAVSGTAAAAQPLTIIIPAAGAGLFHYIDSIEITMYSSSTRVGNSTPVVVSTTNFPTNNAWTFPTATPIGSVTTQSLTANSPIKSLLPNTNTVISCPANNGVIWRVNVFYSVGA